MANTDKVIANALAAVAASKALRERLFARRAEIRTLLAERDAVEEKLQIAAIAMGHGFTRGWRTRLPGKVIGEG